MSNQRALVFSPEVFRRHLYDSLLSEALQVTKAKLSAQSIRQFNHKGKIVEARPLDDHDIQLKAADQIYAMAGVYARERATPPAASVLLEYDSLTGVMRLVIGPTPSAETAETTLDIPIPDALAEAPAGHFTQSSASSSSSSEISSSALPCKEELDIVREERGNWRAIFDEEVT